MSLTEDLGERGAAAPARKGALVRALRAAQARRAQAPADDDKPPFKMPRLKTPAFARHTVDIRDYGARSDNSTDCTAAIAAAVESCADAGGGRVLIPAGKWFTGPIHLQSNIELHLAEGAVVRFDTDPDKYLPPVFVRWGGCECYNYSPFIYARNCKNIAITGMGVLVGQGKSWWGWEPEEQHTRATLYQMTVENVPVDERIFGTVKYPLRPQLILAINCTNVLLDGFKITDGGPQWIVHIAYSSGVQIRRLKIEAADGPNNNGIVIDSSRNVIIEDCHLHTADDCIGLKSGMNEDGWRVGMPTENVIVRRIRATKGTGGFAIGSDMSGGVRNVFVHDCQFDGLTAGIRFKAARGRGGVVQDVFVNNITMGDIPGEAIQLTSEYPSFVRMDGRAPEFRNIKISNVTCKRAKTAVRMIGLHDSALRNVRLENVTINSEQGLYCASGNEIKLLNVRIKPQSGPVLAMKDSQDVIIQGLNSVTRDGVFLDLRGRQTRNIRLCGESNQTVRPAVVLGMDVPRDALVGE
jgi:polygalacturonase